MKTTYFFWIIGIFSVGLGFGLAFGGFFGVKTQQSLMIATTQTASDTEEETGGEVKEKTELWETMEFEGEKYTLLKKISLDQDGQFIDVLHLCKPEAVFGTYEGKELSDSMQCGWGDAERLVMRQGTRINTLNIVDADRSGYRHILMGARFFPGEKLMVVFEDDQCLTFLGLCVDTRDTALLFQISNGAYFGVFELTDYVFNVNDLVFNESATKYINFVGCPEGCPEEVVEGYDLQTKKSYDFLNAVSRYEENAVWFSDAEKSRWIDDSTFQLIVWRNLPQSDETESKIIDLKL